MSDAGAKELRRTGMRRKGRTSGSGNAGYTKARAPRPLTPMMLAVLAAVRDDEADAVENARKHGYASTWNGAAPNSIGLRAMETLDLAPSTRRGNGAKGKASWSGTQAPCQRVLGPLGALVKRELLERRLDRSQGYVRSRYFLTDAGREAIA